MFFRLIIGVFLVAAIMGVIYLAPVVTASAPAPSEDYALMVGAAADLNEQWEQTFDKTGKYPDKQDPGWHHLMYGKLLHVPENDANRAKAWALVSKFAVRQPKIDEIERKANLKRVAENGDGRKRFAERLDTTFLKNGQDATFKVSGPKNTVLEMNYVLINRPAIYKITRETRFLQDAWEVGFKKVLFRNGIGYGADTWSYDAPKDGAR